MALTRVFAHQGSERFWCAYQHEDDVYWFCATAHKIFLYIGGRIVQNKQSNSGYSLVDHFSDHEAVWERTEERFRMITNQPEVLIVEALL